MKQRILQRIIFVCGAVIALIMGLQSCSVFTPLPKAIGLEARLSSIPNSGLDLDQPVTVFWDRHMIPFIDASTDQDAAYALGLVHAHLRLGQLAVARRVAQGRISESAGPLTLDLDQGIRAFNFGRSIDEIYAKMPDKSRLWMQRYADGINAYADRLAADQLPHEMRVLDIAWDPWTPQDSLLLGRVSGIDINWETMLTLLQIEDPALRERVVDRLKDYYKGSLVTFDRSTKASLDLKSLPRLAALSSQIAKAGSNSIVVAPKRSATGAALVANDPHLAFFIPNPWVIVGLRSPGYHIVGMMVPGTPVFGFGRTPYLAWGGTNLRATTSEFVDVSELPANVFTRETHQIAVRLWPDSEFVSRTSPYGPVMSDLDLAPDSNAAFAVRWIGHQTSDEVTALLGAAQARTVDEFREALANYALPPQTFLVADTDGTIGSVVASQVPARPAGDPLRILTKPKTSDQNWKDVWTSVDLPNVTDPALGFLASANNRPASDGTTPFGGHFPQDERIRRLQQLLSQEDKLSLKDLQTMQMDATSPLAIETLQFLRPRLTKVKTRSALERDALNALLDWNGSYAADDTGALIYEAFIEAFMSVTYAGLDRSAELTVYRALGKERAFLLRDLMELPGALMERSLAHGIKTAALAAASGANWGDIHRLDVQHIFGSIPVLGARYRLDTIPISGSQETILKTAHPNTTEEHRTFFGAQARHISSLADPNENYFVLFGGQDGWLRSEQFADQVPLWRDGELIQVPLTPSSVRSWATRTTVLTSD